MPHNEAGPGQAGRGQAGPEPRALPAGEHCAIAIDGVTLASNSADLSRLVMASTVKLVPTVMSNLIPAARLFNAATSNGKQAPPAAADMHRLDAAKLRSGDPVELLVIVSGDPPPDVTAKRVWRVTFDGAYGDDALYAALLSGRAPAVQIIDADSGEVVASGNPCVNDAANLAEAVAFIRARAITLIQMALDGRSLNPSRVAETGVRAALTTSLVVKTAMRRVLRETIRAVYKRLFHSPQWRVGYRFTRGPGVLENGNLEGAPWSSLPEALGHFYADPIPIQVDGASYIFFEDLDHSTNKGVIAYVRLDAEGNPGPTVLALEEPHHLSYPFLIQDQGEVYMLPEQGAARSLMLYRAAPFPDVWVPDTDLLRDVELSDATLVRHDGKYWIFACIRDGIGSPSDTLAVYYADALKGPWTPHQSNPILIDKTSARPAGPFASLDGRLYRVAQDCTYGYGSGLTIAEVTGLTTSSVDQVVRQTVWPGGSQWMGKRLHTLARAGTLECIDGSGVSPRSQLLRRAMTIDAVSKLVYRALRV